MKLINRTGLNFELRIETLEDLWVLSQFIVPSDKVFATTERKVKIGPGDKAKQVKKIIFVELDINKTSFDTSVLRVSGEICNETEFTAIGQAHSLNFSVNDKIKILKKSVLKFEEKLLNSAIDSKKSKNFLVLFDKDELIAAEFSDYNYSILFDKAGLGSKKYHLEELNEEEQKFNIIEEFLKRDYSNVIFSGPGIYKEKLAKYIKDKTGQKIIVFPWSDVSNSAVTKCLKGISSSGVLENSQLSKEYETVSELLLNINSDNKNCYGYDNCVRCINSGSVETLLVSTKLIDKSKNDGTYVEINELMRLVEQLNGDLVIVNSKNESGCILDGLGSVACILRY
jgi:mRNA surveillance protein pelota